LPAYHPCPIPASYLIHAPKLKIGLIAIVGEQEAMNQTLNLRYLGAVEQPEMSLTQLEKTLTS